MTTRQMVHISPLALSALATLCSLGTPTMAQNAPGQNRSAVQDNDTTRQELVSFDQFLDSHPRLAEQIHNDPSLVNNVQFVKHHPALRDYLDDHPTVREEIKENPDAFTAREELHARRVDVGARDRDREFGRDQDRDNDTTRRELANFDRFLDSHREIGEQVQKNPSLVNNDQFVKNHPALQTYLKNHLGVREEVKENQNAFINQEANYQRIEDNAVRDRGRDADRHRDNLHRQFGEFLGGHSSVAQRLSKDPSLVKNEEFMANHPELKEYLKSHPDVQQELMKNPQIFVNSSQKFSTGTSGSGTVKSPATTAAPTAEPKPKQ